ncbi:MAG: hypothetical protein B7Y56_08530 [Gallionellales bacterium 35-53-114]|nr:MAG: hypothetical protein B7Y56_08530 [Gallionellales bacterium 35-53-114]OYZ62671.1 MAG: hypothetical protein B7Y04_12385 [Gallionellales bacterium 24-53-125]OZB09746.1 MAG: hypothetical protein B7X61_04285 [Gallionellales bacterium 39-52-133]
MLSYWHGYIACYSRENIIININHMDNLLAWRLLHMQQDWNSLNLNTLCVFLSSIFHNRRN